mmetsp:Transcript_58355/g.189026  ORF Transcript_58355/g.189026 Transcript_58355/m.189026 type:complete len:323 (+) Transcript_58355:401-1369(+)
MTVASTLAEALQSLKRVFAREWDDVAFGLELQSFDVDATLMALRNQYNEPQFSSYPHELAKGVFAYALESSALYELCRKALCIPDFETEIDRVSAALVFLKFVMAALYALPNCLRYNGRVFLADPIALSCQDDEEKNSMTGRQIFWFEPKRMRADSFATLAHHAGPSSISSAILKGMAWDITLFSRCGESTVLVPVLTIMEVVDTQKFLDPKCLKKPSSSSADTLVLEQVVDHDLCIAKLFDKAEKAEAEKAEAVEFQMLKDIQQVVAPALQEAGASKDPWSHILRLLENRVGAKNTSIRKRLDYLDGYVMGIGLLEQEAII